MPSKKIPVCCRCNRDGICKKCSCSKSGAYCIECLPSKLGRCQNRPPSPKSQHISADQPIQPTSVCTTAYQSSCSVSVCTTVDQPVLSTNACNTVNQSILSTTINDCITIDQPVLPISECTTLDQPVLPISECTTLDQPVLPISECTTLDQPVLPISECTTVDHPVSPIKECTTVDQPVSPISECTTVDQPVLLISECTTLDQPVSLISECTTIDQPLLIINECTTLDQPVSLISECTTVDQPVLHVSECSTVDQSTLSANACTTVNQPVYSISACTTADHPVDTINDHIIITQTPISSDSSVNPLPPYPPLPQPSFTWNDINGADFVHTINSCYAEVVHWRRNLFKIPSGQAGKEFVKELSHLFLNYAESTALECVAMKAAFALPALILQKPHCRSKARKHAECLTRRLDLWRNGKIPSLIAEGRSIQSHLSKSRQQNAISEDKARLFANLMKEGKLKAAQRILSKEATGKPLDLSHEVKENLIKKHPPRQPPLPEAITPRINTTENFHPIIFDQIDGKLILDSALKSDGAAGPSGFDAAAWKRLCSSFGSYSVDLCNAIAMVTKNVCTTYVDPEGIEALVAGRLIALDKCPGVRPIGIGETVRRIMGRAILSILKEDIKKAVGPIQLCAGQEAGCEAAIHAIHKIFDDSTTDAVMLVDATNAFNALNREVALRNIHTSCPALATILTNTYRHDIPLFIGGETIMSQEGTTPFSYANVCPCCDTTY